MDKPSVASIEPLIKILKPLDLVLVSPAIPELSLDQADVTCELVEHAKLVIIVIPIRWFVSIVERLVPKAPFAHWTSCRSEK